MITFLIRRTLLGGLTLAVISVVAFTIIQLPPVDYSDLYISEWLVFNPGTPVETLNAMRTALRDRLGLDSPLYIQYAIFAKNMLTGNFDESYEHNRPIIEVLGDRIMLTVILALATVLFTWVMALPIGIYSAIRQRSLGDYTFTFLGFIGLAVPDFMLALLMMYFAFVWFDADIGGLFSREYVNAGWGPGKAWDLIKHLVIPCIILGTSGTAGLIRILRANLLDELRKPYVVTARAKGLHELRVVLKYPVRVALNPMISTVGYTLPFLISGSVIVSVVLNLHTIGPVFLRAIQAQDMILAATIVMMLSLLTVVGTLISDILLVIVDPRIRLQGQ